MDYDHDTSESQTLDAVSTAAPGAPASSAVAATVNPPEATEAEKAAVKEWVDRIKSAKTFHDRSFKRMKRCQKIAAEGRDDDWNEDNYTVPVLKRHTNVSVAALYARNPTATAKRKKKVQFSLWDGSVTSLQAALKASAPPIDPNTGGPIVDPTTGMTVQGDPNAAALIAEVQAVHAQNLQMDRMAKTLELLFEYYMGEQDADYKQQLKAAVRRVKVCMVGYIKLGFQRILQPNPDITARIEDATSQITTLENLVQGLANEDFDECSAKMDELRRLVADLSTQTEMIVREGPLLSFPKADKIIIDPACVHLKTLAGATWLAHEFPPMTRDQIKEAYGVDIGSNFIAYAADKKEQDKSGKEQLAQVWEIQNKKTQQVMTVCEGYPAWLKAPAAPDVKLSRFWNIFPIVFNEVEDDECIYPNSDVWDARHMQREYNNIRQGLREHRIQNKPKYATSKGMLEEQDLKKLATGDSGSIYELNSLQSGMKVEDVLQAIKTTAIDPNLYEVQTVFTDIERVIGSSQADLGAASDATATQSSIIEQGRSTMNSDNVDDLDDVLSQLARSMGELMLLELDVETVKKIAGPGAVWPTSTPTRQAVADDLWLEVKAGSSGRPNRASELANLERAMPYLLQMPNINPTPVAEYYGKLLELPVEDLIMDGMPSIQAQNAMAGKGAGMGAPEAAAGMDQGGQGGLNAPSTVQNEAGPQPAYPAPNSVPA